ncbi:hypothetical protein AGLY_016482 [Aphis glycines]|uniref:Uncharacterized protein n=1 Tax=Aphis glycines TaxID=307491 RepID=A0A6G0SYS9_APHGL|nr:hypothetical protein AGLY_016482 [Aphis glycines]
MGLTTPCCLSQSPTGGEVVMGLNISHDQKPVQRDRGAPQPQGLCPGAEDQQHLGLWSWTRWGCGFAIGRWILHYCPYLLSSETTAKGTGLEKSAGKEDPVELDSNLALFGDMPRCSISGSRGSRRAVSRPSISPSTLKYHYSHRFLTYSVERYARFRPRVHPAVGRRPVASSARRRFVRRVIGARRGRRAVGLCPFVPGRAPAEGSGRQTADRVRARAAGRQKSPSACAALPRARALVRSVFRGHRQVGSLTGAVHLSKNNAGVLRPAQRGRKPRVEQKGKCWLDPGRSVREGTAKASASERCQKSYHRDNWLVAAKPLTIYFLRPRVYKLLLNILSLPSISTLKLLTYKFEMIFFLILSSIKSNILLTKLKNVFSVQMKCPGQDQLIIYHNEIDGSCHLSLI